MPSTSTLINGFILVAFAAVALILWASQSDANEDGLIVAVFPPGASERQIVQAVVAADGTLVRSSLPKSIVIAHSTQSGFAQRLKAQGVWLTYAQAPFGRELGGCLALATVPFERGQLPQR